jgi:hypothetical protein
MPDYFFILQSQNVLRGLLNYLRSKELLPRVLAVRNRVVVLTAAALDPARIIKDVKGVLKIGLIFCRIPATTKRPELILDRTPVYTSYGKKISWTVTMPSKNPHLADFLKRYFRERLKRDGLLAMYRPSLSKGQIGWASGIEIVGFFANNSCWIGKTFAAK